jgi:hypothetical protein
MTMHNTRGWKWTTFSWAVIMFLILSAAGYCESLRTGFETDTTQATEKVQYALRFVEGQSYDIRIISNSNMNAVPEEPDKEMSSQTTTGQGYRFDVNSVDDRGNALVDCTVTWVKYYQKVRGGIPENQDIDYDSSDKNKQTIQEGKDLGEIAFVPAKVFRALLGEKFAVKMTPRGQVQEIRGLDILRKNMAKKAAERLAANESNWAEESMHDANDMHNTIFLKHYFLSPLAIYPDRPVSIGDSWTLSEEMSPHVKQETTYKLKDRKAGVALIEINRDYKYTIQTDEPDLSEYIYRSGGQVEINESTGQILYGKTNENVSSKQESSSSGKSSTVTTFEMKERKPDADG